MIYSFYGRGISLPSLNLLLEKKENDRGGEFKYGIFDKRIFISVTMYPHPAQQ
jgi:hypothetical protein